MSKIKLDLVNGVWAVSTVFYNVPVIACASHLHMALRALKSDMAYIERELVIRVGGA